MTAPLTLLPPSQARPVPESGPSAREVVEFLAQPDGGHVLVVGAPGSGKTSVAVAAAVAAVNDLGVAPERVLLIAPTRAAAADLRDRVTLAMNRPTGTPVVRTAASTGFAILAAQARSNGEPAPVLLTGAEQDMELRTLLAGHRAGGGAAVTWEGIVPPEATALPGFREELRNLMMRAAESGTSPEQLAALGRQAERPEWESAARAYREYLDVMSFRSMAPDQGERFDPARVVADAADAIDRWPEVGTGPCPSWDLVVVDDYQDATAATTAMLHALARSGARLALFGNADQTVQGFRGAVPTALAAATAEPRHGGFGARRFALVESHRQHAVVARVTDAVIERVGVSGEGSAHRRRSGGDVGTEAPSAAEGAASAQEDSVVPVSVVVATHHYGQARAIATSLRDARHGLHGPEVPWGQMAVIARSTGQLRALRSELLAADIPCETLGDALALHAEPAVAPLLVMLRVALGAPWTEESAVEVLSSRLVGLDAVAMRRLRRALVREERDAGGMRSSSELLVDAMADARRWGALQGSEPERAAKASRAIGAGLDAAASPVATAGTVLWAMWRELAVAEQWRDAAVAGSARDDADLDAVIAMMRAAQVFTERLPHAHPGQFVDYLQAQDFAADSLGARAQVRDVVTFATPASAAGREWSVVAVAGLEEGLWPNLRLRDTVLGAHHLAEILAGRAQALPLSEAGRVQAAHAARRAVLEDETRALAVAVSRARDRLIVTCVEDDESRPSRYLAWIEQAAGVTRIPAAQIRGVSDLRAAVTRLRVEGAESVGVARDGFTTMLAHLARSGAAGAHPAQWHGVMEPSTDAPFWDEGESVRVSPSKVDTVELCALKWALETAGGTRESTEKQRVGTLIHEIAAAYPRGTHEELAAALDERWHEVSGSTTWVDRVARAKADDMVRKLALYIGSCGAETVEVEHRFMVELGRAVLSGSADRVEITDGVARIVDLKTGAAIPKADVLEHGQLSMYQLAANSGGFPGVREADSASLVYVGDPGRVSVNVLDQPPIDTPQQAQRLADVVEVMAGRGFLATPNPMCDRCPVQRSCPAQPAGRQVSDS
jgi:superfamily I DNA/RNA helicase/RecB family exonuclease